MKWTLQPVRDFGWIMKTPASAITSCTKNRNGVYHLHIEHEVITGVTPEMLEWWFNNIGGETEYGGVTIKKYLLWHPLDHIHWELRGHCTAAQVGVGSTFHTGEALGRNMDMLLNVTEKVEKLDRQGILLVQRFAGMKVSSLRHQFIAVPGGTRYVSDLRIGADHLLGRCILNPFLHKRVFNAAMCRAWLKHNIEEVGNFEYFLPALYHQHTGKPAATHDTALV